MRHENGFGTVICLDKTGKKRRKPWAVRITIGWEDSKQIRKYIGYYRTQTEALIALAEYNKCGNSSLTDLTLGEVFAKFLERVKSKESLSKSVVATHKITQNRLGNLENKLFREIKMEHLQVWFEGLNLKPGTKLKVKSSLNQVYAYALANDIIGKNYATALEVVEKVEKVGSIFTQQEIDWLWENSNLNICQHLLILIYTGMRIGELLSVKAESIHLEENYIRGGSKTEAGRDRIIPINSAIKPLIEKQIQTSNYIIHKADGQPINYGAFKVRFDKFINEMGWEHKIHDTRKTSVSLMHSAGIPMEVIRIIVGHSGKGVTEKIYLYKEPRELVDWINKIMV